MQVLANSLKTDRQQVLTCIKYEVLGKRPVYDSYKAFCERIGDDVMGFQEFEFWYMRFYNGELDMDYDRRKDTKPLELLQLPVEMVAKFVEKLDLPSRLFTRNVCKPLQTIVDGCKLNFKTVKFLYTTHPSLFLDDHRIQYKQSHDTLGTTVVCGQWEHNTKRGNRTDFAVTDLKTMLKRQNMQFDYFVISDFSDDARLIQKCLNVFEASLKTQFKIKAIHIFSTNPALIVSFLSLIEPGILEDVSVNNISDEIANTEQWQQARIGRVQIWGGGMDPTEIGKFRHFEEFSVNINSISAEIMVQMRETLLTFPSFKKCAIEKPAVLPFTIDDVSIALGLPIENEEIHVPIRDSIEVLVIKVSARFINIERRSIENE